MCHQHALITSLPFVHTARRYYRLNELVSSRDRAVSGNRVSRELDQTCSFRGSKSRNKVSVGEPAEGSLTRDTHVLKPTEKLFLTLLLDAGRLYEEMLLAAFFRKIVRHNSLVVLRSALELALINS